MKAVLCHFGLIVRLTLAVLIVTASAASAVSAAPSCKDQFKLHSKNSDTPTTITFVNNSKTYRAILWLDFNGQAKDYAQLNPGKSVTLKTFLTHPWMVTTGPGDCLQIVMPAPGGSTVKLTDKGSSGGEEGDEQTSCPPGTVPVPETDNCVPAKKKQSGCWYAVYTCSNAKDTDGPGFTVKSDEYPGFQKGMYCNIGGPFDTKADAQSQIKRFGGEVKQSCK